MDIPANENPSASQGNYFLKYLQFASSIIINYNGVEPFHIYLKKYFSANKKHGGKDRKWIAALCYNYFRLGLGSASSLSLSDRLLLGSFLCASNPSLLLENLKSAWNEHIGEPLKKKIAIAKDDFHLHLLFPFVAFASDEIEKEKFSLSFLHQPKLFIRIRPKQEKKVLDKLHNSNISFKKIGTDCLSFANNERLADVVRINKEVIVQDYNSQRTGTFFIKYFAGSRLNNRIETLPIDVWDCCAGSGGKSLLALDLLGPVNITVTDKRENILHNLRKRFAEAGIKKYRAEISDLARKDCPWNNEFDMIIADVPCSGSGTWARTPEQLSFFHVEKIDEYARLQKEIVGHALKGLRKGGLLFYVTCSVFKKENEENVNFFIENSGVSLLEFQYLKGYEMQADTLFIAVLRKD